MNIPKTEMLNLLDTLAGEINSLPVLLPDDVTIPRLVQKTEKKRCFIERMLAEKVKAGELEKVPCYNPETGRGIIAYRAVK